MIAELKTEFVETLPEHPNEGIIYVSMQHKISVHLCACGCKGKVFLFFGPDVRQDFYWEHTFTPDGKVTTRPSIGNWSGQEPYHAHYYITENRIEPC